MKGIVQKGHVVLGAFLSENPAPNILRLMQVAGLDYVIVDCEHGYFDYAQVAALAAVANGIGFPLIVRIAQISRDCIQKYLDAGVDGLLVPMLESKKQAEQLVQFGKYAPQGKRGISTMRPHSNYNPGTLSEYTQKANKRILLFAQIESRVGVDHAADILTVEGLDGLFVGPNDLACDLGVMGDFFSAEIQESIGLVARLSREAGKPSGVITTSIPLIQKCREMGMTMFSCNSEIGLLKNGIHQMKQQVNQVV